MLNPRAFSALLISAALCICSSFSISKANVSAQTLNSTDASSEDANRGIKLFQRGDSKGAIPLLRAAVKQKKDDAVAWYYLGLALTAAGETDEAKKAFETTVKLRPEMVKPHVSLAYILLSTHNSDGAAREARRALAIDPNVAEAHYILSAIRLKADDHVKALEEAETVIKLKPDFLPAYFVKSQALIGLYTRKIIRDAQGPIEKTIAGRKDTSSLLNDAADSLAKFVTASPQTPELDVWREQLETLRVYSKGSDTVFEADEVSTKVKITEQPFPRFTADAKRAGVTGKILLRAVLHADGTVKHILVLQSLTSGLTEEVVNAARQIKFVPATKDGRPVSQAMQLEYTFQIQGGGTTRRVN